MKRKLSSAHNQDVVLAIGTTGCGKSTMLNALIWGPASLEVKKIDEEIAMKDGTIKIIKRNVIETKNA